MATQAASSPPGSAGTPWKRRGRAHVLGHDVPHDGGVMAFDIVLAREMDPEKIIPQLFAEVDAGLAARLRPGDIIVAGRNFLAGKAHNTGLLGMKALGMSILCESMSMRAYQGVVSLALPVLAACQGLLEQVSDGDEIEVDFIAGRVENLGTGQVLQVPPLAPEVRAIIENDGMAGLLRAHLREHPELGRPREEA